MILCKRGPLFRILHLERHLCSQCERDILHRPGVYPESCPWCGASEIVVTIHVDTSKFIAAMEGVLRSSNKIARHPGFDRLLELAQQESEGVWSDEPGPLQCPHIHDGR